FIDLAIVTSVVDSAHRFERQAISDVVRCDMFKLQGRRTVEIERDERFQMSISLRGEFEINRKNKSHPPWRRIVARIQSRDARCPQDIEIQDQPEFARRLGWKPMTGSGSNLQESSTIVEVELKRIVRDGAVAFEGRLSWNRAEEVGRGSERVHVLEIV